MHAKVRRLGKRMLRSVLFIYLAYAAALFVLQRRMLFPGYLAPTDAAVQQRHPRLERMTVPVEGGVVEAWYMPGEGASAERPAAAVLFAHGNGETIDQWPDWLADYAAMGVGVLMPEYRGYGRSAGSPSQEAIVGDFVRFHDALVARPEVDPKRVVFHGRSIGGGVAVALAARRRPAALILQSTFASVRALATRRFLVPGFLVRDPFDSAAALRGLPGLPVLLAHGTRDDVVPFKEAHALVQAAPGARLLAYEADHNTCPPDWDEWMQEILGFLRANGVVVAPPPRGEEPAAADREGEGEAPAPGGAGASGQAKGPGTP